MLRPGCGWKGRFVKGMQPKQAPISLLDVVQIIDVKQNLSDITRRLNNLIRSCTIMFKGKEALIPVLWGQAAQMNRISLISTSQRDYLKYTSDPGQHLHEEIICIILFEPYGNCCCWDRGTTPAGPMYCFAFLQRVSTPDRYVVCRDHPLLI